jgi:lysozyme
VVISKTYSKAECDGLLKTKLAAYGSAVLKCVNVPISENEYSAYTLFDYNVGSAAFCGSSLLRKLNAGNHKAACDGLLAWVHADGKFVQGLANRRRFERDLCLKG